MHKGIGDMFKSFEYILDIFKYLKISLKDIFNSFEGIFKYLKISL